MPKNESENAIIPDEEAVPVTAGAEPENAWVEFERGRVSRRQALKKLGMTSAMATFALFSVDDLARMVSKAMQQRASDNKVVEQVAKEFQQAGVAFATTGSTCSGNYDCTGCGGSASTGDCCAQSSDPQACCQKSYGQSGVRSGGNVTACQQCCQHAMPNYGGGGFDQGLHDCMNQCGGIS